jgi:hypothetical protein
MLRKIQYVCLVASIVFISADRIDLFFSHGPFVLTPFLVFAPLGLLLGFIRTGPERMFRFPTPSPVRRQLPFVAATIVFLLFTFASLPLGMDPGRGLVLFIALLSVAVLAYGISVQILTDPEQGKLISQAITLGLIVYAVFCIGEGIAWSRGISLSDEPVAWSESVFAATPFGAWAPRLSGPTIDPNRAGFVLTMYLVLLDKFAVRSRYARGLIVFFILLTVSKSAIACWLGYYLFSKRFWVRLASRRAIAWLTVIGIAASVVCFVYGTQIVNLAQALELGDAVSDRMSMDRGSSGESHVLLIERGFDTWLTSPKTIIAGIGFGSAPKVLADFFGNDKYGNFHCLYVTVLAESGLLAFMVLVFILGYPIIGRTGTLSAIAAIAIFNLSYQSHMEPIFWLVLALLWSSERRQRTKVRSLVLARATASFP